MNNETEELTEAEEDKQMQLMKPRQLASAFGINMDSMTFGTPIELLASPKNTLTNYE